MASAADAATRGRFGPVTFEQPVPDQRVRTDDDLDLDALSAEEQEVVTADEFVVFGKANIEQWNDPGPGEDHLYIEMDALENSLDQLLAIENISFAHQDVRVGEPLESHTLDTEATVHLDSGETLAFDAGDDLRTEVIREGDPLPGDNGTADEDALWLAANVFGRADPRGSRFSQQVRLGAYYGDLDGFSVTVDKLEVTPTEQGVRTHEVDFLAVTIGDDEQIKNPGSSFGVAEFQAEFRAAMFDRLGIGPARAASSDAAATTGAAEGAAQDSPLGDIATMARNSIMQRLLGSSKDALAAEAIQQAYDDDSTDLETAAEQVAGDEADAVLEQAERKAEQLEEGIADIAAEQDDDPDADEVEDAAADLADALGMDKEFIMDMIAEARAMADDMNGPEGEAGDDYEDKDDYEDDDMEAEQMSEDEVAAIVERQLDKRLPDGDLATSEEVQSAVEEAMEGVATTEEIESQLDDLGSSLSEDIGEFVEEQLHTGATPGPTGGGVDTVDATEGIANLAEKHGLEVESE